jgi:hypothetical protein
VSSNPAKAVGFFGRKNSQHAFLRRGNLSHVTALRHVKEPDNDVEVTLFWLNLIGHFSPIIPPFANRGLSRRLIWSASGDERGTKSGVSTISLERLQCAKPAPHKEEEEGLFPKSRAIFEVMWKNMVQPDRP